MTNPTDPKKLLNAFKRTVKAKPGWKEKVRDPAIARKYVQEATQQGMPHHIADVALAELIRDSIRSTVTYNVSPAGRPPVVAPFPVSRTELEAAARVAQSDILPSVSVPLPDIFDGLWGPPAPTRWTLRELKLECGLCPKEPDSPKERVLSLCGEEECAIVCRSCFDSDAYETYLAAVARWRAEIWLGEAPAEVEELSDSGSDSDERDNSVTWCWKSGSETWGNTCSSCDATESGTWYRQEGLRSSTCAKCFATDCGDQKFRLVEKQHIATLPIDTLNALVCDLSPVDPEEEHFHTRETVFWTDDAYFDVSPDSLALLEYRYARLVNGELGEAGLEVCAVDGAVPSGIRALLAWHLDAIADREDRDFHPGSDGKVQDLIHPSLHPLVVTGVRYWHYHQWLPAEVAVDASGRSRFTSYINGLNPRTHGELYWCIERVFDVALPVLEKSLGYLLRDKKLQVIVKAANYVLKEGQSFEGSWHIEGTSEENIVASALYYYESSDLIHDQGLSFRRRREDQEEWPYNRYENLDNGERGLLMEWKTEGRVDEDSWDEKDALTPKERAFLKVWDARCNKNETRADRIKSNVFMGTVPTPAGRILTFPNTLQHKVAGVSHPASENPTPNPPAQRKILCFFLVDPAERITSTADVAEQQWETVGPEIHAVLNAAFRRTNPNVGCPILVFEVIARFAGLDRVRWDDALRMREELMEERTCVSEGEDWDAEYNLCDVSFPL
ncbi:hypothetical protein BDK51DRAFT_38878 [Blyttiomyces helicus]|uniref:DUF4246 domain-containing protein n=1 Tax=Blyttiomyces helicus TaxID=388810 RepID=A0A4P9WHP9_9FUNG|nr:hypothetical protein BDK51DRAFT_38878 [Blyttiomyces helicus]|eukprot:RKO90640.1 hypothetical protein BDK51DRAFT_38878 [Blyttiomyces helicus]